MLSHKGKNGRHTVQLMTWWNGDEERTVNEKK